MTSDDPTALRTGFEWPGRAMEKSASRRHGAIRTTSCCTKKSAGSKARTDVPVHRLRGRYRDMDHQADGLYETSPTDLWWGSSLSVPEGPLFNYRLVHKRLSKFGFRGHGLDVGPQ